MIFYLSPLFIIMYLLNFKKENMSCKRIRALNIARNHWGVRTDSGPIAEVVASLAWLARFLKIC